MATMTIPHRRIPILFLAIIATVLLFAISAPSRHAVQNHGENAWSVTQRFKQVDPDDDDVWQSVCPDGRRYTIRQLEGGNVTRFTSTSKDWIARKLAWCG